MTSSTNIKTKPNTKRSATYSKSPTETKLITLPVEYLFVTVTMETYRGRTGCSFTKQNQKTAKKQVNANKLSYRVFISSGFRLKII